VAGKVTAGLAESNGSLEMHLYLLGCCESELKYSGNININIGVTPVG